jgi:2-polyprenyl-3-methyl-5-hydroxy-6-metoxy-1,4-benzoquinol methylase
MYNRYYHEAESVKFWSTHFYKETADARRKKMFRPRALLVEEWAKKCGVTPQVGAVFADIGSGYGIFLEEIERLKLFDRIVGIEPTPNMAEIGRNKGFEIIEKMVEDFSDGGLDANFATAFEVLEHVCEPVAFLTGARRILGPGGFLMFTTLTVSGFDIQVLWENSKSIHPPHHINLLSVDGMVQLVERCGLEIIELGTPGELDVDIVRNICSENSEIQIPRFAASLIQAPAETRSSFQRFLQANRLSSHLRVIATRPKTIGAG